MHQDWSVVVYLRVVLWTWARTVDLDLHAVDDVLRRLQPHAAQRQATVSR